MGRKKKWDEPTVMITVNCPQSLKDWIDKHIRKPTTITDIVIDALMAYKERRKKSLIGTDKSSTLEK